MIKSRMMRWKGHVAHIRVKRTAYKVLPQKPEGKRPLRRPIHRWEDHIKMDFRDIGWGGMDCTDLVHNWGQWMTLVNTVINLRVP
jgi:hypothetical protein